MFRDISGYFNKKRAKLDVSQDVFLKIKETLQEYLTGVFGDDLKGFAVKFNYNGRDNSLIIETGNKTLANELTLQLGEINSFFIKRGIKLDRILVQ